jgi:predicted RNase H-like HicB family nuclease
VKEGGHEATICRNRLARSKLYVSQCLEVDIASQGETEQEALANLKEALELHFKQPHASRPPKVRTVEVEVGAA